MPNYSFATILKDFSGETNSTVFLLTAEGEIKSIPSSDIGSINEPIFFHDTSLIADEFIKNKAPWPKNIADINILLATIETRETKEASLRSTDIASLFKELPEADRPPIDKYLKIFWGDEKEKANADETKNLIVNFLSKTREILTAILDDTINSESVQRFFEIEQPVHCILNQISIDGIPYNDTIVKDSRQSLERELYFSIRDLSNSSSLPMVIPNDSDKIKVLKESTKDISFDIDGTDHIDSQIRLLSEIAPEIGLLHAINKASSNLYIFKKIPIGKNTLNPIFETYGTTTGRILCKDPELQNISKTYRNIFSPLSGHDFLYIDYDQFEAGILASLSSCEPLINMYNTDDIYSFMALNIFGDISFRKFSKRLFLSYSYGMSRKALLKISDNKVKGSKAKVGEFLDSLTAVDEWKQSIYDEVIASGGVSTKFGARKKFRVKNNTLTEKQKRSSISHTVQGLASLIFKEAILNVCERSTANVRIILPMHDALLLMAPHDAVEATGAIAISSMQDALSKWCPNIKPKASLDSFFSTNPQP